MSCTICGRPRLPGGKLCAQCKAALKRARQVTVSQLEPLPGVKLCAQCKATLKRARQATVSKLEPLPRGAKGAAKRRSAKTGAPTGPRLAAPTAPLRSESRGRLRPAVALVALGAVVCAGGYFGNQLPSAGGLQSVVSASETSVRSATPSAAALSVLPAAEPALPAAQREPARVTDGVLPPAQPSPGLPANSPAAKPASNAGLSKTAAKRSTDAVQVAAEPSIARFGAAMESDAVAAAPSSMPAPPPQETPPPDRWQSMSDAIARCGGEGFLAAVICEQRARLQYCDGHWGQVAQCPGGIRNDYPR